MTHEFLLEIGCEELPSKAVLPLAIQLKTNLINELDKIQLKFEGVQTFATPRRLAVIISKLASAQCEQHVIRRGPAVSAPSKAVAGFAKSCGVRVEDLTIQQTDKGSWYVFETVNSGEATKNLLPQVVTEAINALTLAKPMRWGQGEIEFVRPVHWLVMLLDDQCIQSRQFNVNSGNFTYGHRYHAPQLLHISHPSQYEQLLESHFVVADFAKRKQLIADQINQLAHENNAVALMPDELLNEVTSIVEYPHGLLATFKEELLQIPPEVLISSMQIHQKCFALTSKTGQLLPYFIIISNINSVSPEQVIKGNEKVMHARLSDARFFYQQDQKIPLSARLDSTASVIFQAKLGTLKDKALRLAKFMDYLSVKLDLSQSQALRAATLSKCDLMTGMVGEFPELQGLMGYYYATADNESPAVAKALQEQYFPRFSGDILPETRLGSALSLADRLDTLAGIFAIGQKPTGDKDPFKLRRHGLAIVRILLNLPTSLSLQELIGQAIQGYGQLNDKPDLQKEIHTFILERLNSYYQGQGFSIDLITAARACEEDYLSELDKRLNALVGFIQLPDSAALSKACKRVNNLLSKASSEMTRLPLNLSLLSEPAEQSLYHGLLAVEREIKPLIAAGDYEKTLAKLASLRQPIDEFFTAVMVMVENQSIRDNRLSLLRQLNQTLNQVADISCLQLDKIS